MIEYAKFILPKVCMWETLFQKELKKSYNWIEETEIPELYKWCYANFHHLHPVILAEVFKDYSQKLEVQALIITKRKSAKRHNMFANSA